MTLSKFNIINLSRYKGDFFLLLSPRVLQCCSEVKPDLNTVDIYYLQISSGDIGTIDWRDVQWLRYPFLKFKKITKWLFIGTGCTNGSDSNPKTFAQLKISQTLPMILTIDLKHLTAENIWPKGLRNNLILGLVGKKYIFIFSVTFTNELKSRL